MIKQVKTREYKLVCLRECPSPETLALGETPEKIHNYFSTEMVKHVAYNPDVENFFVVLLNSRRKIIGHLLISNGTLDTILVHPREVFRAAILANASAIVLLHNHPSGESTPSDADIKCTRDLIRAGQCLKIEVVDHIVTGHQRYSSLRELGHFYN